MESPIDLECSPTGQRRHLMTRPLTATCASQYAGPAAKPTGQRRTPALSCAPRRARSRPPAHPSTPGQQRPCRPAPHACASRALHDAHAHDHLRIPVRRASGEPYRPAPHACALVRSTTRTLTTTCASQYARPAATLPASAAWDGEIPPRRPAPQAAPDCCPPSS